VRPLEVVIAAVLPNERVKVLLSKCNELVQAFLLDRLHEPFDVGVHVWTAAAAPTDLDSRIAEHPIGVLRLPHSLISSLRIAMERCSLFVLHMRRPFGSDGPLMKKTLLKGSRRAMVVSAAMTGMGLASIARGQTLSSWVNGVNGTWTDPTKWSTNPFYP